MTSWGLSEPYYKVTLLGEANSEFKCWNKGVLTSMLFKCKMAAPRVFLHLKPRFYRNIAPLSYIK